LPRVRVKHVIMKYSQNDVQRIAPAATSNTASFATTTGNDVRKERSDREITKYSQNAAAEVEPRGSETTSKLSSNIIITEDNNVVDRTGQQTTSEDLKTIGVTSNYGDGDRSKKWCDSGTTTRWKRTSPLFQVDDEDWLVKSEGQTPVSTDDHCRVSKTSSLDQLRLRFQHQRKNAGRFRAELDHLKKKVIDAQHELDNEKSSRLKLEEWTDYLQSQLGTYITSRSVVEKQYAIFYCTITNSVNHIRVYQTS